VLLTGETGTGKGVAAEVIHQLSPRANHPFVEVNCGAIPESLLESELFGHEKGAFTGALQRRAGVLERAGEGTVFLDEIGELPLAAQTRLLRVLQNREFERVGGNTTLRFKARIITATNRDLEAAVQAGTFRADLFYRLHVFPINLPPLRERGKADIMLLADFFCQSFSHAMGREITRMDTPAIDMLTSYHWPGNVRELENAMERCAALALGDRIEEADLPEAVGSDRDRPWPACHPVQPMERIIKEHIMAALTLNEGNRALTARQLQIGSATLYRRLKSYGVAVPVQGPAADLPSAS